MSQCQRGLASRGAGGRTTAAAGSPAGAGEARDGCARSSKVGT